MTARTEPKRLSERMMNPPEKSRIPDVMEENIVLDPQYPAT
jgi:hypothetical protein